MSVTAEFTVLKTSHEANSGLVVEATEMEAFNAFQGPRNLVIPLSTLLPDPDGTADLYRYLDDAGAQRGTLDDLHGISQRERAIKRLHQLRAEGVSGGTLEEFELI